MLLAAVDPGRINGFAVYSTDLGSFVCWESSQLDVESLDGCAVVICEDFDINAKTVEYTSQKEALFNIGILKQFCKDRGKTLKMQKRSEKKWSTDRKLKALAWFKPTPDGHQNDAARHLLKYLVKNNLLRAEDVFRLKEML